MDLNADLLETYIQTREAGKRKRLPTEREGLDKDTVDIRGNQLESLGNFANYVSILKQFRGLDASQNYISAISEDFVENSRLRELYLSENIFESMTGFDGNMYLTVLDLSQNQISKIEGLTNLPELRALVSSF